MHYIKEFKIFLSHLRDNSQLIKTLIKNDFKKQYLGSYFGLFWAFVQPITYIAVIWFVFEIGFRSAPATNGVPFFLWLISGIIPWFFFTNGLANGTNSIVGNSFLVKKVAFRTSILPIIQVGSAFIIHLILVSLLILAFLLYGFTPDLYWLQLFYYLFCSIILLIGFSWLTSSIRVFIKDIGNFITVLIQIGFWATPIFWSVTKVSEEYQYIIKANPMYYITDGFRDIFINKVWFWEKGYESLYFLSFTAILFIGGAVVFRKLRPHFGDVL